MTERNASQRFFGNAMMAFGALITVLCGGCTVWFLGDTIWNQGYGDWVGMIASELVVGGLPTAVGVLLFINGQRMKRRGASPSQRDIDSTFS